MLLAHKDGNFMFIWSGWIKVLINTPHIQTITKIKLDGRIIDILRFQHDSPTATFTRPIRCTTEQERSNTITTKVTTNNDVFNTCDGTLLLVEENHTCRLPISQGNIAALGAPEFILNICQVTLKFLEAFIERGINRRF